MHTSEYRPRRERRLFVAAMTVAVLLCTAAGWAALTATPKRPPSSDEQPRNLVTVPQDMSPINVAEATPSGRSTATVSAPRDGIDLSCGDPGGQGPNPPGGSFSTTCTARSTGDFEGVVDLHCDGPAWLTCHFEDARLAVAPGRDAVTSAQVYIGRDASAGHHELRVIASGPGALAESSVRFVVEALSGPQSRFDCVQGATTVLAGGTKTVPCVFTPGGYRGPLRPTCPEYLTVYRCLISPASVNVTSDAPVTIVAKWTFDVITAPGRIAPLEIRLDPDVPTSFVFGVDIPDRIGTYDIACTPAALTLVPTGRAPIECTVTSVGGFDGYVRLYGDASTPLWSVAVPPKVVRVTPAAPATVDLEVVTTGLPLGSYPQILAVQGEVFEHVEQSAFLPIAVL